MNLLFLYTDQQRFDTLAAFGNSQLAMPHLNRLAAESVLFDRAYCTQPVCTPSRGSLLTGLWPHQHGAVSNNIDLDPATPTLAEMLPANYVTGHFGKWHLGDEIYAQHGFREWRAIDDTYFPFYTARRDRIRDRSSYHDWLVQQGVQPWSRNPAQPPDSPEPFGGLTLCSCSRTMRRPAEQTTPYYTKRFSREQITQLPEPLGKPAYLATEAIDFLRRHQRDPFALYVNFFEPHSPVHGPRDHQYDPATIPLPPNCDHIPDESVPLQAAAAAAQYRNHGFDGDPVATDADRRALAARYWGLCSLVDTHVGRILAALDELGLTDRTLVFFTTDHGEMLGAHSLFGKGVMYEESIHVPMLMRLPGQRRSQRVTTPVSQLDVVPTLLDYLGQPRRETLPGQSLRPFIEQPATAPVRDVVVEWNPAPEATGPAAEVARTLLTPDGWKLTTSSLGRDELRFLPADPLETGNLLRAQPSHPQAAALRARLAAWQVATGDPAIEWRKP